MKQIKHKLPPGDLAVWIFIYAELLVFAIFFLGYAFARRLDVDLFNQSQLLLDQRAGFVNTLVLITSSWFVVQAVHAIRQVDRKKAALVCSRWLLAAVAMGSVFLIIKIMEFSEKISQGINLSTNTFYMFYLSLTFFHFLHVILGMIILFAVYLKAKKGGYTLGDHRGVETGASYWHMVDLLWIVLFPLVYIIR
ncbi:MAG: cytochrome c oxidase subunit 3 family protein [Pseudomonadota bacterium]